jgi:D-threo-aldose 1-dehydrogenase
MSLATRRVGSTKLRVTALGLGGASLAGNVTPVNRAAADALIATAFDTGIRYFDTAPYYGLGKSERIMGDGLRDRKNWVLSSKVGRLLNPRFGAVPAGELWQQPLPFVPQYDYSYDGVMRSHEHSLQRLGLNHVDILYAHDPDVGLGGLDYPRATFAKWIKGAYKAMDELRRNGDIKAIGLGVNHVKPISDAMEYGTWDVFLLAGRYTLLEQAPLTTLFPKVKQMGASIVVGGPFNSGILAGGKTFNYGKASKEVIERVKKLASVCADHKIPLPAAALQFPIANPLVSSVIPGPRSPEELKQIVAWWEMKIPTSLWSDLKAAGALDNAAPTPR